MRKLFFFVRYLGAPPWDTGISPPELEAFIAAHDPGRALDLGCGTGTNALTLAKAGWEVVGVDFIGKAVRTARRRARTAGLRARFVQADVSRLPGVTGPFDLVLDIGCFHALAENRREDYAQKVRELLGPGGTYLLYTFLRRPDGSGMGVTDGELAQVFQELALQRRVDGEDRGERPSTWLWYRQPGAFSGA